MHGREGHRKIYIYILDDGWFLIHLGLRDGLDMCEAKGYGKASSIAQWKESMERKGGGGGVDREVDVSKCRF